MGRKSIYDEDDDDQPDSWEAVRDLFQQLIKPCFKWHEADIIAEPNEMAAYFRQHYPGVKLLMEDLRLAMHDLNVPFERNEHNNKFYYLAKWK